MLQTDIQTGGQMDDLPCQYRALRTSRRKNEVTSKIMWNIMPLHRWFGVHITHFHSCQCCQSPDNDCVDLRRTSPRYNNTLPMTQAGIHKSQLADLRLKSSIHCLDKRLADNMQASRHWCAGLLFTTQPDWRSASVYEKDGYRPIIDLNSVFVLIQYISTILIKPGCQTWPSYSKTERIIIQQ